MKNLRRKNRLKNNNQFKQIIYQIKHLILKKTIINNKRNKHRMIHFINYLFRLVFLCKINWPSLNRLNSLFCFNVECWFLFVLIFSYLLNWIQSMKWPINFFIVIHHGYLSSISKTFKVKSIHFQTFFSSFHEKIVEWWKSMDKFIKKTRRLLSTKINFFTTTFNINWECFKKCFDSLLDFNLLKMISFL